MFLIPPLARLRRDEQGSTLAAAIGVFAVTLILGSLVLMSTVSAIGFTSGTRAGVQSQAAADAGIAVAQAALLGGTCETASTHGLFDYTDSEEYAEAVAADVDYTGPLYSAQVEYWNVDHWQQNCPAGALTDRVRIVASGDASSLGVAGNTRGDRGVVEAVYDWTPAVDSGIEVTGSAVYMHSQGVLNDADVLKDGANSATIMVRNGAVDCSTNSRVQGDLIVASGSATIGMNCVVDGDVLASGTVHIQGKVGGSVSAAGTGESIISPEARIGGSVILRGSLNAWGPRCPAPNGDWEANGNACSARQSSGATSVRVGVTGADAPVAPVVPPWTDFAFTPADWAGWDVVTWSDPSYCNINNYNWSFPFAAALSTYTTPTVIDARGCGTLNFSNSSSLTMDLKTDITFIARAFSIEGITATSNSGTPRELRFITPDLTANGEPDCLDSGGVKIDSSVSIVAPVAALIYTPCTITNSDNDWRGQMYAGSVQFNSNAGMRYVGVGLPQVDLDIGGSPGEPAPPAGDATLGPLTSYRELSTSTQRSRE